MSIRIRVTRNAFAKVGAELPAKGGALVQATTLEITAGAKERSRVEIGTMKRGWHARFMGLFKGTVSNPVEYTVYNELGTSKMPAQPMVTPAVDQARAGFYAGARKLFG